MNDQQPTSDEPKSVLPVPDEKLPETITIITTSTSPSHTPTQLSPVIIRTITPSPTRSVQQSPQQSPLPSPSSSLPPPSPSPSPQPAQQWQQPQQKPQQQPQYQQQEYQETPVSFSFPTDQSINISDEAIKEDPLTLRLTDLKIFGSRLPGDNGSSPSIVPEWFDRELFDLGRLVGRNHLSSVLFSHLSGLSMIVHIPSILATLLATGKSRTLGDIFTRYLGTLSHVITWYEGDIWDQNDAAHKSLITVRRMHSNVASRMNPPRSGKNYQSNDHYSNERQIYLSQYDMALTQFGFIGLIILHPKQVGFPENSQDLVGLVHFWRCVGYLLGLDDRFNILDESDLPGTRALCARLLESEFKPAINRYPTNQASQMNTAIIQAIKAIIPILSTRGFTKYLYKMTTLEPSVSLDGTAARVGYQGIKVIMRNCLPKPLLTPAINALLKKSILRAQKKSDTIKSRLTNKDDLILEETCFTDV